MRIDYSEPKKSYISSSNPARQRKESSGTPLIAILLALFFSFAIGFGSGWFLSQKATKRSFQAATEQKSLENNSQVISATLKQQPVNQSPATVPNTAAPVTQGQNPSQPVTPPAPPTAASSPETAFSFYKNLPSGQKSSVLGSGVNTKDDSRAKQPLQAAIPSNTSQDAGNAAQATARSVSMNSSTTPRTVGKNGELSGFSVQIASFPLKSEAEQSRAKLASKGYNAYVVESNLGNKGIWYRVQIGKKMEQSAAKELALKLGKSAIVIAD